MTRIMIDAGHGGHDPGARGNGLVEKAVVLELALAVAELLPLWFRDVEVRLTRQTDVFIPLMDRTKAANAWPADLFLSLHCDASGDPKLGGFWTFHRQNPDKAALAAAKAIHARLAAYMQKPFAARPDRGCRAHWSRLTVLHSTKMPALLVECLFLTNRADADLLKRDGFRQNLAAALALGLGDALGLQERTPGSAPGLRVAG